MTYVYNCAKCGKPATLGKDDDGTDKKGQMTLGTWSCKPCGGKVQVKREKA